MHEAAASICSGVFELIPVDLHDLVHEAAIAGYAAAPSDLEEGKLDDRVRVPNSSNQRTGTGCQQGVPTLSGGRTPDYGEASCFMLSDG
ncbi:hypothetical protein ACWDZX_29725 [Streptomyces collinus]